jgi:beta-glucanase (GH16 family)
LIERISAEHDLSGDDTGRHRRATVATGGARTSGRLLTRRLAPLAVGAVVMLIAATVATLVDPPQEQSVAGPELSSALIANNPTPVDIAPAAPTAGATASPTPVRPAPAPAPTTSKKPAAAQKAAPKPAPVSKPVASAGNGVQAAVKQGWTKVGGDEFDGSGLNGNWGPYDGAGHAGNGRRTPDAIKVGGGVVTITGDSGGNSGGMAWGDNQTYGKWEMRARFPKGDGNYHPVLLLWPEDGWPPEIDFAETSSDSGEVGFFLHYSSSNQQESANRQIDITQWHNYAVEWTSGGVTGYIDGVQWFQNQSGASVPQQPMHPVIQLDNFGGTSMQTTQMMVDYMRIYR